ncbi:signal recognition particle receptor subunit alpha [Kocuria rhizophila]|nr:signal recognition particle receptor subunit alpha [Kocuria rhizophila]
MDRDSRRGGGAARGIPRLLLRKPKAPKGGLPGAREPRRRAGSGRARCSRTTQSAPWSARPRAVAWRGCAGGFAKSNNLGKGLLVLLSRERISQDTWDEIEDTLLMADLGTDASLELVENLEKRVRVGRRRGPRAAEDHAARGDARARGPHPGRFPRADPLPASPPWCSWWASTAWARPPRWASWPACSSPRTGRHARRRGHLPRRRDH